MKNIFEQVTLWTLSIIFLLMIIYIDTTLYTNFHELKSFGNKFKLVIVLFNLLFILAMCFPIFNHYFKKNKTIIQSFLDLEQNSTKITLITFKDFVSDLATASFLISLLTFIGTRYANDYNTFIIAIFMIFIFICSILIASVAMIKFLMHFIDFPKAKYISIAIFTLFSTYLFLIIGIKFVT